MNIPTPTLAEAWRTGYEDGTHGRRDEARYARDNDDARLYRDGHRMARRAVNNSEHNGDVIVTPPPGPDTLVSDHCTHPINTTGATHVVAAELNKIWDKGAGGTPSSFIDPTPGKRRAKQPKPPADGGQQSLF